MSTPRFDATTFADPAAFVADTTYAIWNGPSRDPHLIDRFYAGDAVIHIDGGDLHGAADVLANTEARLRAFPDFHGTIEETIWTRDEDGTVRTSMRWSWSATSATGAPFDAPSGRPVTQSAIANCLIRDWTYVEEWLAADQLNVSRQLGVRDDDAVRHWSASAGEPGVPAVPAAAAAPAEAARPARAALEALLGDGPNAPNGPTGPSGLTGPHTADAPGAADRLDELYAPDAEIRVGRSVRLTGPGGARGLAGWWRRRAPEATLTIDDQYALERDGLVRAATQWTIAGPELSLTGISHHHLRSDAIVAEWHEFDGLQLRRQLAAGRRGPVRR